MNDLDRHLGLWINGWPDWFSPFLTFFSIAMEFVVVKACFAGAVIAMVIKGGRSRVTALLAVLSCAIADGLTNILKHQMSVHRPFQFPELAAHMTMRVGTTGSMGTASAHAANMAAVAVVT
ncbi:MAG TPA: hypothetical protein VKT78_13140, partial [Fimbriimonadaceae bacterium]|nr:hypothetical protein [Fimbriimonadaceae bacterium]